LSTSIRLTPTSYVVLGLVRELGEATPYALKQAAALSVGNFWSLQHAQLYSEPERLAKAGLLDEELETTGRRRKTYRLTRAGRDALDAWLAEPPTEFTELRHRGLLKLALGADPRVVAPAQLALHEAKLAEYESLTDAPMPRGLRLALDSGIGHEREWVRFWRKLADDAG
jgi:PadR family transcriptional regulator, regulatory protein AphA